MTQPPTSPVVPGVPTTRILCCQGFLKRGDAVAKAADAAIARLPLSRRANVAIALNRQLGDGSNMNLLRVFQVASGRCRRSSERWIRRPRESMSAGQ
jgi:hypothetical protein